MVARLVMADKRLVSLVFCVTPNSRDGLESYKMAPTKLFCEPISNPRFVCMTNCLLSIQTVEDQCSQNHRVQISNPFLSSGQRHNLSLHITIYSIKLTYKAHM